VRTFLHAVDDAVEILQQAGLSDTEGRRDAVILARWLLGWDSARWLTENRRMASEAFVANFAKAVARRAAREPVAYITGTREFYGRSFTVTPAVLIPRPETELVVDTAREVLATFPPEWEPVVVDAGTGSGCLAVSIALEHAHARVIATERSSAALDIARLNAGTHGLGEAIEFVEGNWFEGLHARPHLIVANPPYVPARDRDLLMPEVGRYEPADALFAGEDGLDAIRGLVPAAATTLVPGGALIMEIGAGQVETVAAIVGDSGFVLDRVVPDLQSHPRVVVAHVPVLPHRRR
jgi:release factor glutamine methyltransferase